VIADGRFEISEMKGESWRLMAAQALGSLLAGLELARQGVTPLAFCKDIKANELREKGFVRLSK
jgi:hypothetical protein